MKESRGNMNTHNAQGKSLWRLLLNTSPREVTRILFLSGLNFENRLGPTLQDIVTHGAS